MNLAEIRKKADGAKKTAKVAVAADQPGTEIVTDSLGPEQKAVAAVTESFDEPEPFTLTEMEPEEFAAGSELFAEAESFALSEIEPESFPTDAELFTTAEGEVASILPDEMFADLEDMPAVKVPRVESTPEVKPESPAGTSLPQDQAPPAAAAVEPVRTPSVQSRTAPSRKGYNPLAIILSGREEAGGVETDTASVQQQSSSADIEEYLCFRVADEEYALNIMSIKEIIKPREVTEVPRMPSFISGVISLRGVIIPVMDMRLRLSMPAQGTTGRERIIVLRIDAGFCGVLVDEVVQVARIRKSDIEEPPAVLDEIDRDFVRGLGHFDNRMLILLNLETITDISIH